MKHYFSFRGWRDAMFLLFVLIVLGDAKGQTGHEIYANTFETPNKIAGYWNLARRELTPKGHRPFLGRFHDEVVTFKHDCLPEHKFVEVEFDLLLIGPWCGSPIDGRPPSIWQFGVENGPVLVSASFSTFPDLEDFSQQSYPMPIGLCCVPAYTGARESKTLGFARTSNDRVRDAVYKMRFVLPHGQESVALNLGAIGRYRYSDEKPGWGIDNFRVTVYSEHPGPHLNAKEMKEAWDRLDDSDIPQAHKAVWDLIAQGERTVGYLETTIGKRVGADEIKELESNSFKEREIATRKLVDYVLVNRALVEEELGAKKAALEVQLRTAKILESLRPGGAAYRRLYLTRFMLEVIGTSEAKDLLRKISS